MTEGFDLDGLILAASQKGLRLELTFWSFEGREATLYLDEYRERPREAYEVACGLVKAIEC